MSSVEESAHRSVPMVSSQKNSAHRSTQASPWPRELGVTETVAVDQKLLAPVIGEVSSAWWELRRRYTMTVRGHRYDARDRVMRFFTRRGFKRAHDAYLEAHRRVYQFWYSGVPIS